MKGAVWESVRKCVYIVNDFERKKLTKYLDSDDILWIFPANYQISYRS